MINFFQCQPPQTEKFYYNSSPESGLEDELNGLRLELDDDESDQ